MAIIVYVIADMDRQRNGMDVENDLGRAEFDVIGNEIVVTEYKVEKQFLEQYQEKLEQDRKDAEEKEQKRLAIVEERRIQKIAREEAEAEAERKKLAKIKEQQQVVAKAEQQPTRSSGISNGRKYRVETLTVTAYAPYDNQSGICSDGNPNKTSTGSKPAHGTVAVNPKRFPYGTEFYIEGYGRGVGLDTGGAMRQNSSKIDIFMNTAKEARNWGVRKVKVRIYE